MVFQTFNLLEYLLYILTAGLKTIFWCVWCQRSSSKHLELSRRSNILSAPLWLLLKRGSPSSLRVSTAPSCWQRQETHRLPAETSVASLTMMCPQCAQSLHPWKRPNSSSWHLSLMCDFWDGANRVQTTFGNFDSWQLGWGGGGPQEIEGNLLRSNLTCD